MINSNSKIKAVSGNNISYMTKRIKVDHGLFAMIKRNLISVSVLLSFIFSFQVFGEANILDTIKVNEEATSETTGLLGESIDLATGSINFSHVDVALPGNSNLEVAIRRTFNLRSSGNFGFVDWKLDVPFISAVVPYLEIDTTTDDATLPNFNLGLPDTTLEGVSEEERQQRVDAIIASWLRGTSESTTASWALGANFGGLSYAGYVGHWGDKRECTGGSVIRGTFQPVSPKRYWSGVKLNIPGQTSGQMLEIDNNSDDVIEGYKTQSNWKISCFDRLDSENNKIGEGFTATSPEGITYTFDRRILQFIKRVPLVKGAVMKIYNAYMVATKAEDRFGNTVNYNYESHPDWGPPAMPGYTVDGARLKSISANDGREIVIDYITDGTEASKMNNVIDKITANGRVWDYQYASDTSLTNNQLLQVKRPDNSSWKFDMQMIPGWGFTDWVTREELKTCAPLSPIQTGDLTLTHPNGVVGNYKLNKTQHGRTEVENIYQDYLQTEHIFGKCFRVNSLVSKTLTGPGLNEINWQYDYSQNDGAFKDEIKPTIDGLVMPAGYDAGDIKSTTITAPDGSKTEHYFHRSWYYGHAKNHLENKEVMTRYYDTDGTSLMKQVEKYFDKGNFIGLNGVVWENIEPHTYFVNLTQLTTRLYSGATETIYNTEFSDFNDYGVARKTYEHNDITNGKSRYTKQTYKHDTTNWVLNQPRLTQVSSNDSSYTTISENTYHTSGTSSGVYADLNLPYEQKSYGQWKSRNVSYHADGNVNKVEFNQLLLKSSGEQTTQFRYQQMGNYKRGQPQTVSVPRRYTETGSRSITKVIDNNGWVTATTDLNGNVKYYNYDELGRLTAVDLPGNWTDTLFEWSVNANGNPLRISKRCTLNSTRDECSDASVLTGEIIYDSLFQPTKVKLTDPDSGVSVFTQTNFNAYGKQTFSSYPNGSDYDSSGVTTTYDGMQRLISQSQSGGGSSSITYLNDNKQKVSDFLAHETTTSYLAYGSPAYKQALVIESPESVITTQAYNIFGELTSVTQAGPGKNGGANISQTQHHVYDTNHNLCKTVRNDVGQTKYSSNILGEILWMAEGVSGGTNTDCTSTVSAAEKVYFAYDNRGARHQTSYGDGTATVTQNLDPQGNLSQLISGSITQTYNYNSLNLLDDEALFIDGKSLVINYGYTNAGYLSSLTYPNGNTIAYSPNGFGQATKATTSGQNFATGATYYPGGQLDTFTYGNGLNHKTTLNSRQIPESIIDSSGSVTAIDLAFTYDNNNNIKSITDGVNNAYSLTSLSYDGLDRLTSTTGNNGIGNSSINYDGLGNITSYDTLNSSLDYTYNTTKNVLSSVSGTKHYNFNYDSRGNVSDNGTRSFTYNRANQLTTSENNSYVYDGHSRRVKTTDSKGISYSLYSQSGRLLYRETEVDSATKLGDAVNYIFLGDKLIAKEGAIADSTTDSRSHYKPFGESIETPKDDVGYTGHKFDADLGLSYMQARYYDPVIGRFYSNDPVGFRDVHSFNRYAYANNNPYKYVDPDGMAPNQAGTTSRNNVIAEVKNYERQGLKGASVLSMLSKNHGTNTSRYLYTDKHGWVDLRHFGRAAELASSVGSVTTEALGFANEVAQFATEWGDDYRSGFSPEDISSNAAGAEFGDDYLNGKSSVSQALGKWFNDAGARDANDPAAGASSLPATDPATRGGANRGSSNMSNTNGPGAKACPNSASSCS